MPRRKKFCGDCLKHFKPSLEWVDCKTCPLYKISPRGEPILISGILIAQPLCKMAEMQDFYNDNIPILITFAILGLVFDIIEITIKINK